MIVAPPLTQVNWSENTRIDDCDGKVEHFNFYFHHVLNRHAPVKSMKIRFETTDVTEE